MAERSVVLQRQLSTGDVLVFDEDTRDLFLIDSQFAETWDNTESDPKAAAQRMVEQGQARYFDREMLGRIQAAFSNIVMLGE
ncbi:MAG TPA: hypothetical protein VKA82_00755 [Rubrobacter sp.]|nr:hypothetical protein [Rubrobacter sp.]